MARLRPLRTKEEIDKVPHDKSVTLELQPEGVVDLGDNPFEQEEVQAPQDTQTTQKKPKVKEPPPREEEDDATDLKRQLEEMRLATAEKDKRINEEIRARQEAEARVKTREQEANQSKIRAEDAEYDAILNAIGAAESEAEGAQRDIAFASEANDPKGIADASRRMARAESRLVQLQDGKDAIERQKTQAAARAKEDTERPKPATQPTVEQYIDSLPNLMQSQREWLRKHPDALTDNRKNMRLQGAHVEAEDQGITPGSTEYFEYLEERLGYKKAKPVNNDQEDDEPTRAPVSAPPSRNATNPANGRPSNTRITLTPEQREIARLSGIDELTYARQLQRMNALKADGLIQ